MSTRPTFNKTVHVSTESSYAPVGRLRILTPIAMLLLLCLFSSLVAQWSRDPSEALRLPEDYYGYQIVSDSLGGVFISAWGGNYRTFCYYINPNGRPLWNEWVETAPLADFSNPTGYAVCPEPGILITISHSTWITEDGDTSWDLRAQKINVDGEFLWPDSGITVSDRRLRPDSLAQFGVFAVVTDGEGGMIVLWGIGYWGEDESGQFRLLRISRFAQKVSVDGELLWEPDDNLIQHPAHQVVSDGEGGIIILSAPYHQSPYIKFQRISQDGEPLWGNAGLRLELHVVDINAVSDGFGGTVFGGQSTRDSLEQIKVFRLDQDGNQVWGDGNGVIIQEAYWRIGGVGDPRLIVATDSIFFINWSERVPHPFVQAIDLRGNLMWNSPGVTVCDADSIGFTLFGVTSYHTVIYGWRAARPDSIRRGAFYCQRVDTEGDRLWGNEGVMLFDRRGMDISDVVTDCFGGAIFQIGGLYLQHVNRDGELGVPLTIRSFDQPLAEGFIQYSLFPNPANNVIAIKLVFPTNKNVGATLFDLHGRPIFSVQIPAGVGAYPLDISTLPSGLYILQIRSDVFGQSKRLNIIK